MKSSWEDPGHPVAGDLLILKTKSRKLYIDYGLLLLTGRGERGEMKGVMHTGHKIFYTNSCILDVQDMNGIIWELHESHFKYRFIVKTKIPYLKIKDNKNYAS